MILYPFHNLYEVLLFLKSPHHYPCIYFKSCYFKLLIFANLVYSYVRFIHSLEAGYASFFSVFVFSRVSLRQSLRQGFLWQMHWSSVLRREERREESRINSGKTQVKKLFQGKSSFCLILWECWNLACTTEFVPSNMKTRLLYTASVTQWPQATYEGECIFPGISRLGTSHKPKGILCRWQMWTFNNQYPQGLGERYTHPVKEVWRVPSHHLLNISNSSKPKVNAK